jgi:hypothetical protein
MNCDEHKTTINELMNFSLTTSYYLHILVVLNVAYFSLFFAKRKKNASVILKFVHI